MAGKARGFYVKRVCGPAATYRNGCEKVKRPSGRRSRKGYARQYRQLASISAQPAGLGRGGPCDPPSNL